ncbi:MAG TPA: AMP-binding protein, partial [Reyranella sp.]
ADKLYEIMAQERVTVGACVPTVWLTLVDHLERNGLALPALRAALVAGTKAPRSLIEALEQRGVDVAQCWGMTEALGITKCSLPPGLADAPDERRLEQKMRQGRVAFTTQLRIVDDAGKELPRDGEAYGNLEARGPTVTAAYLKQPASVSADGWLQTGDVAKLFPDGTVEIVDRSKDVIKSGGEWIASAQVENAAMGHPAVAQAAVIGIAHPRWQERPLLVVVPRQGQQVTAAELIGFLRPQMASWWLPDEVVFVEALPMTATGKIHKVTLRERFKEPRHVSHG